MAAGLETLMFDALRPANAADVHVFMALYRRLCPTHAADVHVFMALYRRLCPTHADEALVTEFARQLGWTVDKTAQVAAWLAERGMIETDAGLGGEITRIEGRSGT